eukprot:TRINITY_DN6098_c0_g1_i6.p1 TRINITY_DN6098_c0_g1~~TRINITY_DN6098_c0_g1_i6.p1  ORF type:complete len:207 (+),score=62.12 TRINITY_DN6098_c0_g1_i6:321-941(+)
MKGENRPWLKSEEELLSFFLNLHNFIVLFGLCKTPPAKFPKSHKDWFKYLGELTMNVGGFFFSPVEIQHCLLRASLSPPKIFAASKDLAYPQFAPDDSRLQFRLSRKEPLVNFGFSYPFKSSPQLKVYREESVYEELRKTAGMCLAGGKLEKSKGQLQLPGVMEMYEEDFAKEKTKEEFILFVRDLLPSEVAEKYKRLFEVWYVFY